MGRAAGGVARVTSLLRLALLTGRKNRVHPLGRMHLHTKNERFSRLGK
jgi:hypothetical protein